MQIKLFKDNIESLVLVIFLKKFQYRFVFKLNQKI